MRTIAELGFELARAQMQRASAAGVLPRVLSVVIDTMDGEGKTFSVRATFTFGSDLLTTFTLDAAADLSSDWRSRFDHAMFSEQEWLM